MEDPIAEAKAVEAKMLTDTPVPFKRDKIGSHLSYPLKFSEIVASLSPGHQLRIQVWFRGWPAPARNVKCPEHRLLSAEYRIPHGSQVQPVWWLFVRPIPRELRVTIRALLLPEGFNQVSQWYTARRTPNWFADSHQFQVVFNAGTQRLTYEIAA